VAELAPDQRQRVPFVAQLEGMGMAQLVRRHPSRHASLKREVVGLGRRRAG
jgi:hypothetical protein